MTHGLDSLKHVLDDLAIDKEAAGLAGVDFSASYQSEGRRTGQLSSR